MSTIEEQARAEAAEEYPPARTPGGYLAHDPRAEAYAEGFLAGHEAASRPREVTTVAELTDALYEATSDPNDINVPDVAKRLHALLFAPEEES